MSHPDSLNTPPPPPVDEDDYITCNENVTPGLSWSNWLNQHDHDDDFAHGDAAIFMDNIDSALVQSATNQGNENCALERFGETVWESCDDSSMLRTLPPPLIPNYDYSILKDVPIQFDDIQMLRPVLPQAIPNGNNNIPKEVPIQSDDIQMLRPVLPQAIPNDDYNIPKEVPIPSDDIQMLRPVLPQAIPNNGYNIPNEVPIPSDDIQMLRTLPPPLIPNDDYNIPKELPIPSDDSPVLRPILPQAIPNDDYNIPKEVSIPSDDSPMLRPILPQTIPNDDYNIPNEVPIPTDDSPMLRPILPQTIPNDDYNIPNEVPIPTDDSPMLRPILPQTIPNDDYNIPNEVPIPSDDIEGILRRILTQVIPKDCNYPGPDNSPQPKFILLVPSPTTNFPQFHPLPLKAIPANETPSLVPYVPYEETKKKVEDFLNQGLITEALEYIEISNFDKYDYAALRMLYDKVMYKKIEAETNRPLLTANQRSAARHKYSYPKSIHSGGELHYNKRKVDLEVLSKEFETNPVLRPSRTVLKRLSNQTELRPELIADWFKNQWFYTRKLEKSASKKKPGQSRN